MKDKYDELRTAIAAVRKVNADFLEILPARRGKSGDETSRPRLAEKVALAAYDDHEGQFILLPKFWCSQFKRRGAPAFWQFIESERINNRYTGRARLIVS